MGIIYEPQEARWHDVLRLHRSRRAAVSLLSQIGIFLIPTFLRPSPPSESHSLTQTTSKERSDEPVAEVVAATRRDTDYLDGMRGLAALMVCLQHFFTKVYPALYAGYGYENYKGFFILPIIKGTYHGGLLVNIFFVVSGFALSSKGIQLIRIQSTSLLKVLSSTTFRRSLRLFLPAVISSFIAFLCQRAGVLRDRRPKKYTSTLPQEIREYGKFLKQFFDLFNWKPFTGFYNPHLWTIPVEFRCSLVVFITLLAVSRCRTGIRLAVELSVGVFASIYDRWDIVPFMWGMVLAEIHYYRKARTSQLQSIPSKELEPIPISTPTTMDRILGISPASPTFAMGRKIVLYAMIILGLWMGGFPHQTGCKTPTYVWMCNLDFHSPDTEKWRYITGYAAILFTTSVSFLPPMQKLFTTPFCTYLGKVSYALYLTHGTLNRIWAIPTMFKVWQVVGKDTVLGTVGAWGVFTVFIGLSFWMADVFMRAVDMPSVKLAQRIERWCLVES